MAYCQQFCDEYHIVFPIHPNTLNVIEANNISTDKIQVISPLSYLEMNGLISEASLVLTDSGGIQKEAYFHETDCITLRDETEWPETVDAGWNKLWTSDTRKEKKVIEDFGAGNCCGLIINQILNEC